MPNQVQSHPLAYMETKQLDTMACPVASLPEETRAGPG